MAQLFLPVLSHFQNENPWSASTGRMPKVTYNRLPRKGTANPVTAAA